MSSQVKFPPGFLWGAAAEDGRRPSIWDTFCRVPGNVRGGDTGDIACDHHRSVEADLDLMAELQLSSYRFSISWPRVLPDARGKINQVGLDFYERLVDGLLARNITPLLTVYHWDLPQPLQDNGGWVNREPIARFVEYAEVIGRTLGDRVPAIATLNEPLCSAFLGYASGVHAPGIRDNASALTAAHHLNLAHGCAVSVLRQVLPSEAQISITLNIAQVEPASESDADQEACRRVNELANRIFLEPILRGRYSEWLIADTHDMSDWSFLRDGDLNEIAAPMDLLGINYYAPSVIAAAPRDDSEPPVRHRHNDPDADAASTPWPGTESAYSVPQPGPCTDMGWPIDAGGLTRLGS